MTRPTDLYGHVNEDAELKCDIRGYPEPTIYWLKVRIVLHFTLDWRCSNLWEHNFCNYLITAHVLARSNKLLLLGISTSSKSLWAKSLYRLQCYSTTSAARNSNHVVNWKSFYIWWLVNHNLLIIFWLKYLFRFYPLIWITLRYCWLTTMISLSACFTSNPYYSTS